MAAVVAALTFAFWAWFAQVGGISAESPQGRAPVVTHVDVGDTRSCAVLEDGRIVCWMIDWRDGELGARSLRYTQVAVGEHRTCAISLTGRLICDDYDIAEPGVRYRAVSVGSGWRQEVCAIRRDRSVWCLEPPEAPLPPLPEERDFDALSIDEHHACALRTDQSLHCWLLYVTFSRAWPLEPPPGAFTSVSVGSGFACAVRTDGQIRCWGADRHGETDAPAGEFIAVDAGHGRACAVRRDATLTCWGDVRLGEDPPPGRYRSVSVGHRSHCAVTTAGQVACWGDRSETALGAPAQEPPAGPFIEVAKRAGIGLCLLRSNGDLFCNERLDYPFHRARQPVVDVETPGEVCAVLADATLSCGADSEDDRAPQPDGLSDHRRGPPAGRFASVDGHEEGHPRRGHWCALRRGGEAQCWGDDAFGQARAPAGRFRQLAVANLRSCGLTESGEVSCWGARFGDEDPRLTKPSRTVLSGIAKFRMTPNRVCGLRTDARLACWDGERLSLSEAQNPSYRQIEMSEAMLCALNAEQLVDCWLGGEIASNPTGYSTQLESGEPARFSSISVIDSRICGALKGGGIACTDAHSGSFPWRLKPSFGDQSYAWLAIGPDKAPGSMRCAITVQGDVVCDTSHSLEPLRISGASLRAEVPAEPIDSDASWQGRFGLRRLATGETEVRFLPAQTDLQLSRQHAFSLDGSELAGGDWTSAGEVVHDAESWGRLQARGWEDGSVEASLLTPSGERVFASARSLPGDAPPDRWFDSGQTSVPARAVMVAAIDQRWTSEMAWILRADGSAWAQRRAWLKRAEARGPYRFIDGGADALCAVIPSGEVTCSGRLHGKEPGGRFMSVSVGRRHACGVRPDGRIACWGGNMFRESNPPPGRFHSVSAGGHHSCAVGADKQVRCWGLNWQGQASPPDAHFASVGAGTAHSCGLTVDGRILCWGANGQQQSRPPDLLTWPPRRYRALSVANRHACAVSISGSAVCWGALRRHGVNPPGGHGFDSIFTFERRTYAITDAGGVVWWGRDDCDHSALEEVAYPSSLAWYPLLLTPLPSGKAPCPH